MDSTRQTLPPFYGSAAMHDFGLFLLSAYAASSDSIDRGNRADFATDLTRWLVARRGLMPQTKPFNSRSVGRPEPESVMGEVSGGIPLVQVTGLASRAGPS